MYDTILVPTAGDPGAERAVEHAVEEAQLHGARLHVLSVADPQAALNAGTAGGFSSGELREEAKARARDAVEAAAEYVPSDVPTETHVRAGAPKDEILDHVEDHDVDLVVMATHGRTGIRRYLIGSTTESVVRHSDAPVLTVRTDADE